MGSASLGPRGEDAPPRPGSRAPRPAAPPPPPPLGDHCCRWAAVSPLWELVWFVDDGTHLTVCNYHVTRRIGERTLSQLLRPMVRTPSPSHPTSHCHLQNICSSCFAHTHLCPHGSESDDPRTLAGSFPAPLWFLTAFPGVPLVPLDPTRGPEGSGLCPALASPAASPPSGLPTSRPSFTSSRAPQLLVCDRLCAPNPVPPLSPALPSFLPPPVGASSSS